MCDVYSTQAAYWEIHEIFMVLECSSCRLHALLNSRLCECLCVCVCVCLCALVLVCALTPLLELGASTRMACALHVPPRLNRLRENLSSFISTHTRRLAKSPRTAHSIAVIITRGAFPPCLPADGSSSVSCNGCVAKVRDDVI